MEFYQAVGHILEAKYFDQAELIYPPSGELHKSVAERVAKIYKEATRNKTLSQNAFAVQIRRALEALCESVVLKSVVCRSD